MTEQLRPADEDERPCEWQGAIRRDCVPHRGAHLRALALFGIALGFASCCWALPGVLGLPVSLFAWRLASRDLAAMRAGLVDPDGARLTQAAREQAVAGIILTLLSWVVHALAFLAGWHPWERGLFGWD
jgi:hypothetical protein